MQDILHQGLETYARVLPRMASREVTEITLHQKKLCTGCLGPKSDCPRGCQRKEWVNKSGQTKQITCPQCGKNKNLRVHQNCQQGVQGTPVVPQPRGHGGAARAGAVNGPPVTLTSSTQAASITELRTEIWCRDALVNPNPLGAASELTDFAVLEHPDGTRVRVRTLYDSGATDSVLDYSLARFFHHTKEVKYTSKGVNSSKTLCTHIGDLRIIRRDGTFVQIKALKGELSSPAFTLKRKTVDVPPALAPHFTEADLHRLPTNDVGDIRVTQPVEDYQVQLLLGQDNVAWGPKEVDRVADGSGQLILYRSYISSQLLLSGSRRTGPGSTTTNEVGQRRYLIKEEGSEVSLMRSGIQTQDSRNLFNVDSRKTLARSKDCSSSILKIRTCFLSPHLAVTPARAARYARIPSRPSEDRQPSSYLTSLSRGKMVPTKTEAATTSNYCSTRTSWLV